MQHIIYGTERQKKNDIRRFNSSVDMLAYRNDLNVIDNQLVSQ